MRDFDAIKKKEMSSIENRIRHIYNVGYEDCLKDQQKVKDEAYKQGLEDAWECCKRFWQSDENICRDIFNIICWEDFFDLSPSEAIEKFKEYDKKTFDVPDNCKIEVGDEVRNMANGCLGVVIKKAFEGYITVVSSWGNTYSWETGRCNKTGKRYKQFAEAISSLQDDE